MRIATLALTGLLLTLAAWWGSPPPAYACSCAYAPDNPELVRMADVIFVGTKVGDRTLGNTRTYTFTVDRVYKGQAHATQKLTTQAQGPACGLELNGSGPFLYTPIRSRRARRHYTPTPAAAPARAVRPPIWARGTHLWPVAAPPPSGPRCWWLR